MNRIDLDRIRCESALAYAELHPELPSTNSRALDLAADRGLATPALVLAARQTAGRGRGTHAWWAAAGAVTCSLIVDLEPSRRGPAAWPTLSLVAATAVCDVLESHGPGVPVEIRWPNDVCCGGRKICGILPELPPDTARVVLGIGVNVNNSVRHAPDGLATTAVALCDLVGDATALTEFVLRLVERLNLRFEQHRNGSPEPADAWRARCMLRGRTVSIESASGCVTGVCTGITADGGLELHTEEGPRRFYGGTIPRYEGQLRPTPG